MIHSGVAVWGSLLFTIGRVYCAMADRHLGYAEGFLGLKGHRAAWKERKHAAKANFSGGFWFWVLGVGVGVGWVGTCAPQMF